MELKIKRLVDSALLPTRAHAEDAGLDLYAAYSYIVGRKCIEVDYGFQMEIPIGYFGLLTLRSSSWRRGLKCNLAVIDAGYRGRMTQWIWNESEEDAYIYAGDRIGQLLILPCALINSVEVDKLNDSLRGEGGYGSSGH